jgi:hypothetical protein
MSPGPWTRPRSQPPTAARPTSRRSKTGGDAPRGERTNIRPYFLLGCFALGLALGFVFQLVHDPAPPEEEEPPPPAAREETREVREPFALNTTEVRPEVPDLALPSPPPDPDTAAEPAGVASDATTARAPRPPLPAFPLDPRWGLTGRTALPPPAPAAETPSRRRRSDGGSSREWEPVANPELDI